MRFLIDANLSPVVAKRLAEAGHPTIHVFDLGMHTATDDQILAHALANGQVIISADSDFTAMLALSHAATPSLILLRSTDRLAPTEQADLLVANIPTIAEDLAAGAVVSLSAQHLRVRLLPLR
jgi:predicted nuclease of predicted toxin-antitoxin system